MDKTQFLSSISNYRYSAVLLLAGFVIVKLFHLNISFFWDESWVYAPAVQAMAERGPSLLPDSIALEYSRGHPLLFHFLTGLWIRLFGNSYVSMHTFPLIVSVGFLVYTYLLSSKIFSKTTAFWILLFVCTTPIFVAQSSMVLPEVMLAFFSTAAIYYYLTKKYWVYLIFGTAAILTKETGIIVICSVVFFDFILNIFQKKSTSYILKKGVLLTLPLLVFLLHMLYLKRTFGWYLYPEHTGLMKQSFSSIVTSFAHVIMDQAYIQQRYLIGTPFIFLYLYHLLRKWSHIHFLITFIVLTFSAYVFKFHGIQYAFTTMFIYCLIHLSIAAFSNKQSKNQTLLLLLIFVLSYGLFSAANFYTVRYVISTFVFVNAIPIYFLIKYSIIRKYASLYLILCACIFSVETTNPEKVNDVNLTYLYYCPSQLEVLEYLEKNELYEEQINTLFLMSVALSDQKAGYRSTDRIFNFLNKENNKNLDYYVFYTAENDPKRNELKESKKAKMIKKIERKNVWFEIWKETH